MSGAVGLISWFYSLVSFSGRGFFSVFLDLFLSFFLFLVVSVAFNPCDQLACNNFNPEECVIKENGRERGGKNHTSIRKSKI